MIIRDQFDGDNNRRLKNAQRNLYDRAVLLRTFLPIGLPEGAVSVLVDLVSQSHFVDAGETGPFAR